MVPVVPATAIRSPVTLENSSRNIGECWDAKNELQYPSSSWTIPLAMGILPTISNLSASSHVEVVVIIRDPVGLVECWNGYMVGVHMPWYGQWRRV